MEYDWMNAIGRAAHIQTVQDTAHEHKRKEMVMKINLTSNDICMFIIHIDELFDKFMPAPKKS